MHDATAKSKHADLKRRGSLPKGYFPPNSTHSGSMSVKSRYGIWTFSCDLEDSLPPIKKAFTEDK